MLFQLNMVISSQNELITSLRSTVEECNATISSLREQVEYLTRKLFDEAEQEAKLRGEEAAGETVIKEHTRSARRTTKETFKAVPSRDEVLYVTRAELRYPAACCGVVHFPNDGSLQNGIVDHFSLTGSAKLLRLFKVLHQTGRRWKKSLKTRGVSLDAPCS